MKSDLLTTISCDKVGHVFLTRGSQSMSQFNIIERRQEKRKANHQHGCITVSPLVKCSAFEVDIFILLKLL